MTAKPYVAATVEGQLPQRLCEQGLEQCAFMPAVSCSVIEITMALTHLQCMLDIALSLCAACVSAHKGKGTLRSLCRKLCLQCSNCRAAQVHKLHQLHTPTHRHQLAVFMLTAQSCAQIQAVVASLAGGGLQLLGAESAEQAQIAL